MCTLSATQVLASAMSKLGTKKMISIVELIKYNNLLLERISDYHNTIDINELSFEVSCVANEFEIYMNENYEQVIRISQENNFNYALYKSTMPEDVAKQLEWIDLPN